MNHSWFEMLDLRNRKLNKSVWIPLRAEKVIRNEVEYGYVGYQEEFIGSITIAVSKENTDVVSKLDWNSMGINRLHTGHLIDNQYVSGDILKTDEFEGLHLVLNQYFNSIENNEWHLHQDLITTLGLKREGDIWVCPCEGYIEVVKLVRDDLGKPILLEIRNQFLKDYLCGRGMELYITSFNSRRFIYDESIIGKIVDSKAGEDNSFWECRVMEIHEGGHSYGQKIAVSHAGRTDVSEYDDIPDISEFPNDSNVKSEFWEKKFDGKKLYHIMSELWKNEWIEAAKNSPRVRGDNELIEAFFIINEEGEKVNGKSLLKSGKWLWFKPELMMSLNSRRGSFLYWYTKETGSVGCAPDCGVHFGVNKLGFITVYAKDIGYLPVWQQIIWSGYNIPPEGGISKELHASQVLAEPSSTLAPEVFLRNGLNEINELANSIFNTKLFRNHESIDEILDKTHRFRAIDLPGLFSLAKDITRVIVDDLDIQAIQGIAPPPAKVKLGSLKSLENLLTKKVTVEFSRKITAPLVGIYELRHGDAHLPSSGIENSFKLLNINRKDPYIIQGYQMLHSCVDSLYAIKNIIENWNN